jgi:uncharacterized protein YdhG (YjbR/CyaY superfamily)
MRPDGDHAVDAELARYARGKGSVRFPLDEPLPADFVRRIAAFRVEEVRRAVDAKSEEARTLWVME